MSHGLSRSWNTKEIAIIKEKKRKEKKKKVSWSTAHLEDVKLVVVRRDVGLVQLHVMA